LNSVELGRSVEDFGAEYVALSRGVDNVTAEIDSWRAAGGTHVAIATTGFGLDSVDTHVDYLASISRVLNTSDTCPALERWAVTCTPRRRDFLRRARLPLT
jgi:hypothetical protein